MASLTVGELAALVGGRVEGDPARVVAGIASLASAGPEHLSFLANGRYRALLETTRAGAVILDERTPAPPHVVAIRVGNPDLAFARAAETLLRTSDTAIRDDRRAVHPSAVVSPSARLGRAVRVGAGAVVDDGAEIGDGTEIGPLAYVGRDVRIGAQCRLHAGAIVLDGCRLGDRVILHAGCVIGSDGFGYATDESGRHHKIPQLGIVVLEDDVEIGANTTVDRARFDRTIIRRGAKIDNLVMIAHNVEVGENAVIAAQAGVAGSARIGRGVVIAGQAGIAGHVQIGDHVRIAGQTGVTKTLPAGATVSGTPARPHAEALRDTALVRRLPELLERLRALEREVEDLKRRLYGGQPADAPQGR